MADIYQRQIHLKWQIITKFRVPLNVSYLQLQCHCCLHIHTVDVCNILVRFVLHAVRRVVHYVEHCSNMFGIPILGYVFIHVFICLFVVLRFSPLLL
jgi:hypothetical protein